MPDLLHSLATEPLTVRGAFPEASNTTLLAETADGYSCVYKPDAGERPLWDFPGGTLGARERATYLLAQELGWDVVPATVLRDEGPQGPGMCQEFVAEAGRPVVDIVPGPPEPGWLAVAAGESAGREVLLVHRDLPQLRRLALLDVVANNADRKGGHILRDRGGAIWGIDHGLTWHVEDKLRTVLWGFAGQPLPPEDAARLAGLSWDQLAGALAELLTPQEIRAARQRAAGLVRAGRFPGPEPGWPRLPWPPL